MQFPQLVWILPWLPGLEFRLKPIDLNYSSTYQCGVWFMEGTWPNSGDDWTKSKEQNSNVEPPLDLGLPLLNFVPWNSLMKEFFHQLITPVFKSLRLTNNNNPPATAATTTISNWRDILQWPGQTRGPAPGTTHSWPWSCQIFLHKMANIFCSKFLQYKERLWLTVC